MPSTGLIHITTSTFSGVSSVSIDNCFSATYKHYLITSSFDGTVNPVRARLRASGSDASGSNYARQIMSTNGTSATASRQSSETSWGGAPRRMLASVINFAEIWISNPFVAIRTTAWIDSTQNSDGNIDIDSTCYLHEVNTSYDGFSAIPDGGTITGSISVFGLALS
jgi:hypothetical protein